MVKIQRKLIVQTNQSDSRISSPWRDRMTLDFVQRYYGNPPSETTTLKKLFSSTFCVNHYVKQLPTCSNL